MSIRPLSIATFSTTALAFLLLLIAAGMNSLTFTSFMILLVGLVLPAALLLLSVLKDGRWMKSALVASSVGTAMVGLGYSDIAFSKFHHAFIDGHPLYVIGVLLAFAAAVLAVVEAVQLGYVNFAPHPVRCGDGTEVKVVKPAAQPQTQFGAAFAPGQQPGSPVPFGAQQQSAPTFGTQPTFGAPAQPADAQPTFGTHPAYGTPAQPADAQPNFGTPPTVGAPAPPADGAAQSPAAAEAAPAETVPQVEAQATAAQSVFGAASTFGTQPTFGAAPEVVPAEATQPAEL
ncbi:MAG: hypothetical protein Q3999_08545, partial [Buchananella hordeovulneris]|nr:hypothetical protein [Buchananella hordeovulneris]